MEEETIVIRDQTIIAYYRENPQLDIVAMNHVFMEILKTLSTNLANTINTTIHSKLLSAMSDMERSVATFKSEIIMTFNDRLMQTKKDYVEDLKLQLSNNFLTNNEKLTLVMDKTTEAILSKTSALIHEIIPKSHDRSSAQIENCIRTCCSTIEQDTKQLLGAKHIDETACATIVENIEKSFGTMMASMQAPILTVIQTNEERTTSGIQSIKHDFIQQQVTQERLTGELHEFLNKYTNNSSTKGNVSESEVYSMLLSIFPTDEVLQVGTETATCDFRVNRRNKNKPTILVENKDYAKPVSTGEVAKFERDLQTQKHHGIFLSQKTPITYKENFQIDIIKGLIHVYVPNANYDTAKLKIAVDLIDNLSEKLQLIAGEKEEDIYETNKRELEELANEYQRFALRKTTLEDSIKHMSKQILDQVDEMQLPKLGDILEKFGVIETSAKCPGCSFRGKRTKASLGAHCHKCPAFIKLKETNPELATYYEDEPPEGKRKKASPKPKGKKQKQESMAPPPLETPLDPEEGIIEE